MWQKDKAGLYTLAEAKEHVANLSLGGYVDWRLPTREESLHLMKIWYWKRNGDCHLDQQGDFWTIAGKPERAFLGHWEDYLLCGPEFKYVNSRKAKGYVRAIRP